MRSHRQQPNRLPRPWDSPGKNTGVGCHILLQCMKVKRENKVAQSCLTLFVTSWTVARQDSLSFTISHELKLISIESVMPSNHLVLCVFFISCLQSFPTSASVILEPPKIKSVTVSIFSPSIFHEVVVPDAMIFVF